VNAVNSKPVNVVGMISGTSYDAIEAVAVTFTLEDRTVHATVREHVSVDLDEGLRAGIATILPPQSTTIEDVCRLDTAIGQRFADIARDLSDQHFNGEVDVVCSHGQTVFHWVHDGHALGTLQLGQGAWIAERTGATVVYDVRSRDVAAGGHGAPLASLIDVLLLGARPDHARAALNLGGISNVTVVGPDVEPVAYDIGPANALMDAAVTWLSDSAEHFDRDGARGARGVVDDALLNSLLAEPYYGAPAPKSTGKELFHLDYLQGHLIGRHVEPDDLVATLTALTATTVADQLRQRDVREVYASGGGTRNPTLMSMLAAQSPGVRIGLINELGVDESAKEAVLFALIGFLSVQGLPGTVASCTGARHATVLGAILPGRYPVTQRDSDDAPTSLVFEPGKVPR
jgi:anhydro-N-acetylmuramic acid kinase